MNNREIKAASSIKKSQNDMEKKVWMYQVERFDWKKAQIYFAFLWPSESEEATIDLI